MLQQIIFITQFATDNEPSSVLCIVSCCVHCPAPPNDEGAPCVLSAVSCTALQYLHTIYSLLSIYTVSTLYLSTLYLPTLYPPIKLLRHIILGA